MEYSEASKIRNKSFGSLLAEQEGGALSSLGKTISLKSQAKVEGLKEKFDPLNVAKFVTGGSNWAPALLGKLTGRKQSTINYFSGVKGKNKGTASKLNSYGVDSSEVLSILQDIESLLHKNREDDKLSREKQQDFSEEKELEKEKRHKELIKALRDLMSSGGTITSATATKVGSGFSFPGFDFHLPDIAKMVKELLSSLIPNFKNLIPFLALLEGSTLLSVLKEFKNLKNIQWLVTLLSGPAGLAAALVGSGLLTTYLAEKANIHDKNSWNPFTKIGRFGAAQSGMLPEQMKDYRKNQYQLVPEEDMGGRPAWYSGSTSAYDARKKKIEGFIKEESRTFEPEEAARIKKAYNLSVPDSLIQKQKEPAEKGKNEVVPKAAAEVPTPKETVKPEDTKPATPALPRQEAGPQMMDQISKATSRFHSVQDENQKLNLPEPKKSSENTVINNSVNKDIDKDIRQVTIPMVRNDEPTLQDLMVYSTRIV